MIDLNIKNETAPLKAVVLGIAKNSGPEPKLDEAYDPKSMEHILAGTYPTEEAMRNELKAVEDVLLQHNVTVYRPEVIENYNQIFARDIAFVVDDLFIKSNILPERDRELEAIQYIIDQIDSTKIIELPENCHVEGGDVMPWNEYLFIGTYSKPDYPDFITARTNVQAVEALRDLFPKKKVKSFELRKSNTDAFNNALHLDCCFQPVGKNKAILHKNGFLNEDDYYWLIDFFGKDNVFDITKDEMYYMNSNIFSISEEVVISEKNFMRLNAWLRKNNICVEEVPYAEIAKQEGLLRCSTMPLIRD